MSRSGARKGAQTGPTPFPSPDPRPRGLAVFADAVGPTRALWLVGWFVFCGSVHASTRISCSAVPLQVRVREQAIAEVGKMPYPLGGGGVRRWVGGLAPKSGISGHQAAPPPPGGVRFWGSCVCEGL